MGVARYFPGLVFPVGAVWAGEEKNRTRGEDRKFISSSVTWQAWPAFQKDLGHHGNQDKSHHGAGGHERIQDEVDDHAVFRRFID
jgi:hypothetical protein